MKRCCKCHKYRSLKDFSWKTKSKRIRHSLCKFCNVRYARKYYHRNKSHIIRESNANRRRVASENVMRLMDYLNKHPCVDCGEADPVVLQCDHVRGRKKAEVTKLVMSGYRWEVIEKELVKCESRCANCHVRKTARQHKWRRADFHLSPMVKTV